MVTAEAIGQQVFDIFDRVYAPTASPADTVLTLVGLPHLTSDPHTPPTPGTPREPTA